MLQKISKRKNITIQQAIAEVIAEGLRHEITNLKKLEGERLESFVNIFSIQSKNQPEIYYNMTNVLFCEANVYEQVRPFLSSESLVMKVEIPKMNINIWCHEMFSDPLMNNLFDDFSQEKL